MLSQRFFLLIYLLSYQREWSCNSKVAPLINLGQDLKPNEFRFVGIVATIDEDEDSYLACTGTLITENLVLTSAHCFQRSSCEMMHPDEIRFAIGNVQLNRYGWVKSADHISRVEQVSLTLSVLKIISKR